MDFSNFYSQQGPYQSWHVPPQQQQQQHNNNNALHGQQREPDVQVNGGGDGSGLEQRISPLSPPEEHMHHAQHRNGGGNASTSADTAGGRADSADTNEKPKKRTGGGRPRDQIWAFYDLSGTTASCRFCDFKVEHPKAHRLRLHSSTACEGLPAHEAHKLDKWIEEQNAKKKARQTEKQRQLEAGKDEGGGQSSKGKGKEADLSVGNDDGEEDSDDLEEGDSLRDELGDGPARKKQKKRASMSQSAQQPVASTSSSVSSAMHVINSSQQPQSGSQQQQQQLQLPFGNGSGSGAFDAQAAARALEMAVGGTFRLVQMPSLRSPITCHVLDSVSGKPAHSMRVRLDRYDGQSFNSIAQGSTDADGRCSTLLQPAATIEPGVYKMTFYTKEYFSSRGVKTFYPWVEILFEIVAAEEHYHVPLLLSPYAYSTYRGS